MPTAQDDYKAATDAAATVTTDTATIAADQAKLTADQATLTTDTAAKTAADAQLAKDLAAGPGFVPNSDGTITILSVDPANPESWISQVVQPLGNLSSVTPTPAPTPTPTTPPAGN